MGTACCSDTSISDDDKMPKKTIPIVRGIRAKIAYNDTTNWIQQSATGENIGLKTPIDTQNLVANPGWTDYFSMSLTKCTGCEFEYEEATGKAGKKSFVMVASVAVPAVGTYGSLGTDANSATEVYEYNSTHNERVAGTVIITMRTTNFMTVPLRISSTNVNFVNDWIYAAEQFKNTDAETFEMFDVSDTGRSKYKKACAESGTFGGTAPPAPGQAKSSTIVDRHYSRTEPKIENKAMYEEVRPFEISYQFVKGSVCMDYASAGFELIANAPATIKSKRPTTPKCAVQRAGECAVVGDGCTWSSCSYSTSSLFAAEAASLV